VLWLLTRVLPASLALGRPPGVDAALPPAAGPAPPVL